MKGCHFISKCHAENFICSSVSLPYRQYIVTSGFIFDIVFVMKVQERNIETEILRQISLCRPPSHEHNKQLIILFVNLTSARCCQLIVISCFMLLLVLLAHKKCQRQKLRTQYWNNNKKAKDILRVLYKKYVCVYGFHCLTDVSFLEFEKSLIYM